MAKAKAGISVEPQPPAGMFGTIGDKGVIDLLSAVGRGEIERDNAHMTLVTVYGMETRMAQAVLPGTE